MKRESSELLKITSHIANGAKHFQALAKHHDSVGDLKQVSGGFDPRAFSPRSFSPASFKMHGLNVRLQNGRVIHVLVLAEDVSGIGRKKSEALDVEAETQPRFQPALWRLSAMVFQLLKTGLQLKLPVRIVNFSRLQFVGALPHMERVCIAATFGRGAQIDSHGPPRIQCADDLRRCSKWLPMNIGLQSHVALTGLQRAGIHHLPRPLYSLTRCIHSNV